MLPDGDKISYTAAVNDGPDRRYPVAQQLLIMGRMLSHISYLNQNVQLCRDR